jgi:SAM-dependent methyltransferase
MQRLVQRAETWFVGRTNGAVYEAYCRTVNELAKQSRVLDVGAGKISHVSGAEELFLVDASFQEIKENPASTLKLVGTAEAIPLLENSVSLVCCSYLLEHIRSAGKFLRESCRVLRPGGALVALFACRYAPFATLNRVLPNQFVNWALRRFVPNGEAGGFPVTYADCYGSRIKTLLNEAGFQLHTVRPSYYEAFYYQALPPIYFAALAYDYVVFRLGMQDLCSALLIHAEKAADPPTATSG